MKQLKQIDQTPAGSPTWHRKFSEVIIKQLSQMVQPLKVLQRSDKLLNDYTQSEEMVMLYSCLLAAVRFVEGVSWGYSPMLMHQKLDKEALLSLKITFNQLMLIKQSFRENPHLSELLNRATDVPSSYLPREVYKMIIDKQAMHAIISNSIPGVETNPAFTSLYQQEAFFRKTYASIKRSIDDWLRLKNMRKIIIYKKSGEETKEQQTTNPKSKQLSQAAGQTSKDVVSVQELLQYKHQFRAFTKT